MNSTDRTPVEADPAVVPTPQRSVAIVARILHCRSGMTLVELLVGLTIVGFISGAAVIAIHQILTASAQANDMQVAVSQVRAAEHWMVRDILSVQDVAYGEDNGFDLVLDWDDINGDHHTVRYYLEAMPSGDLFSLRREHTGVSGVSELEVASYIDASQSLAQAVGDPEQVVPVVQVTLVATVRSYTASRLFEARPRVD